MTTRTLHLTIHGHVQGVFFRESMRVEADRLGVSGWVRNRGDGTVEATVQGAPAAVDEILRWAQHGPPMARVERVNSDPAEGSYSTFEVIRSS